MRNAPYRPKNGVGTGHFSFVDLLRSYWNFEGEVWNINIVQYVKDHPRPPDAVWIKKPRPSAISESQKVAAVQLYEQGLTTAQVAAKLGIGTTTVNRILKSRGIVLRPRGRYRC